MAVTRTNGAKRLAEKSVTEDRLADSAVTTVKIADDAVTPEKLDDTLDYLVNKFTAHAAVTLEDTLEVDGTATLKDDVTAEKNVSVGQDLTVSGNANVSGNVVISGNLQVDGDQVIANTSVMEVEDKNITVNKGGNADSMSGSGITVDNTDGDNGSLVYDSALATKWKLGIEGSEVEVVDVSTEQTLSNKTYMLKGDAIEDKDNIEDALRALDDKVNNGTAYETQEGDTASSNYDSDNNTWDVGEAIEADTSVKVYVEGIRLRSGTKDDDGNISNDYSVDYDNGKVEFAEAILLPGANITVEYIPAS